MAFYLPSSLFCPSILPIILHLTFLAYMSYWMYQTWYMTTAVVCVALIFLIQRLSNVLELPPAGVHFVNLNADIKEPPIPSWGPRWISLSSRKPSTSTSRTLVVSLTPLSQYLIVQAWFQNVFRSNKKLQASTRHVKIGFTKSIGQEAEAHIVIENILGILCDCDITLESLHIIIPQIIHSSEDYIDFKAESSDNAIAFGSRSGSATRLNFKGLKEVIWDASTKDVLVPWKILDGNTLRGLKRLTIIWSLNVQSCFNILEQCPELEYFNLDKLMFHLMVGGTIIGKPSGNLVLDKLEELCVCCESTISMENFFYNLDIPKLRVLNLGLGFDTKDLRGSISKTFKGVSELRIPVETMEKLVVDDHDYKYAIDDIEALKKRNSALVGRYGSRAL